LIKATEPNTSIQPHRDTLVTLRDHTTYTEWMTQLKARCAAYSIWPIFDPESTIVMKIEPTEPEMPQISNYAPAASVAEPTRQSELSTAGLKAFKEDLEYYKIESENYRMTLQSYEKQQTSVQQIVLFIQSTVTSHLQKTCCEVTQSHKQWISNLRSTVGVDDRFEKERARERYRNAIKPLRSTNTWEIWLAEYDQAATESEAIGNADTLQIDAVISDFIDATAKQIPIWTTTFRSITRLQQDIDRRTMMRSFREHMMAHHPIKPRSRAAFAVSDQSFATSRPHMVTDRDASPTSDNLLSTRKRGRLSKSSNNSQPSIEQQRGASTEPQRRNNQKGKCHACGYAHLLKDCFYLYPERAPEWFTPKAYVVENIELKRQHDTEFQDLLRGLRKPESKRIKRSDTDTPTPTRITEAIDE